MTGPQHDAERRNQPREAEEDATVLAPQAAEPGSAPTQTPQRAGEGLQPGSLLHHTYRILGLLARGGMGEVYRARHLSQETEHVIKVLLPEHARNAQIVELFRREPLALRRVRHDAVVAYDGSFLDEDGRFYVVMEYVDGPSLSELLRQRGSGFPPAEVLQLRDRLAGGLAAAHAVGIVHRDLSPDNVILPGGSVTAAKIIDFGIAKNVHQLDKTMIGDSFAGKMSYVAPEQLGLHGGHIDARTDIYSLGLVLAAAGRGRPLDMGDSWAAVTDARRQVPDLSDLPASLQAELGRMLEPDPADRPASMEALITRTEPTRPLQPLRPDAPPPGIGKTSRRRSRAPLLVSVLLLLVLLGGGLGYLAAFTETGDRMVLALGLRQPEPSPEPALPTPEPEPDVTADVGDAAEEPEPPPSATAWHSRLEVEEEDGAAEATVATDEPLETEPVVAETPIPELAIPEPTISEPTVSEPTISEPTISEPTTQLAALPQLHELQAILAAGYDCALLDGTRRGDGLQVTGFVSQPQDLERLHAAVAELQPPPLLDVAVTPAPDCRVLQVLVPAATAAPAPVIRLSQPDGRYRIGDHLIAEVEMPAERGGYLYVDYVDRDGNLLHLFPIPPRPDNRLAAGERVTLGTVPAEAGPGDRFYSVVEPLGRNLIFAYVTERPLFAELRPEIEEAETYLAVLARALEQSSGLVHRLQPVRIEP